MKKKTKKKAYFKVTPNSKIYKIVNKKIFFSTNKNLK